jgi:hypothetical protein
MGVRILHRPADVSVWRRQDDARGQQEPARPQPQGASRQSPTCPNVPAL